MEAASLKQPLDIQDICNLLGNLGFVIKDSDEAKKDVGRCIEITCNVSGKKILLESADSHCNCPPGSDAEESEKWEVSGTSGGVQTRQTEINRICIKELSQNLSYDITISVNRLLEMINTNAYISHCPGKSLISQADDSLDLYPKVPLNGPQSLDNPVTHNSMSSLNMQISPLRVAEQIKNDTPGRYRSLDTLTDAEGDTISLISGQGTLSAIGKVKNMIQRQSTYTVCDFGQSVQEKPASIALPSRTSSPVPFPPAGVLSHIIEAEFAVENLRLIIQEAKKQAEEEASADNSAIDVSKIGKLLPEPRPRSSSTISTRSALPYSSSPNLSKMTDSRIPQQQLKRQSLSGIRSNSGLMSRPDLNCRSMPRKLPGMKTISPSFSGIGNKKEMGVSSVLGSRVEGTYKSLEDKSVTGGKKATDSVKKKNSLYSHIKPTIMRYSSSKK